MYGYVYKTTNLVNGKIYVGQKKSDKFIPTYFGSGTLIRRALKKYGESNFDVCIIEKCYSRDELNKKEIYWIKELKSQYGFGIGYNITPGGEFGDTFTHLPEEEKEKKRELHRKNNILPEWTEERKKRHRERYSGKNNSFYGKKHNEETRRRLSEIASKNTGEKHPFYGKKHSPEAIEKQRKSAKRRFENMSEEEIQEYTKHLREWYKNNPHHRNKKVIVLIDGVMHKSFDSKKSCVDYFKKFGLGKKSIERNLLRGEPILPDSKKGFSEKTWKTLTDFKSYEFFYEGVYHTREEQGDVK